MEEGGGPRAAGDTGENLIEVGQWRWGIGMGVNEDLGYQQFSSLPPPVQKGPLEGERPR